VFVLGLYSWEFPRKRCGYGFSFLIPVTHLAYLVGDFVKYTLYFSVVCFYKFCYIDFFKLRLRLICEMNIFVAIAFSTVSNLYINMSNKLSGPRKYTVFSHR
jgi:hypothetical protein